MAIWYKNTAFLICKSEHHAHFGYKISFTVHGGKYQLGGTIFLGPIFKTAAFLASLNHSGDSNVRVEIDMSFYTPDGNWDKEFNPDELACILDASPTRQFEFAIEDWSVEQSIILATRPYPIELELSESNVTHGGATFKDDGTAFVKALEKRQSSFGSLCIDFESIDDIPFSDENLTRLFKVVSCLEKPTLPSFYGEYAEFALRPCLPRLTLWTTTSTWTRLAAQTLSIFLILWPKILIVHHFMATLKAKRTTGMLFSFHFSSVWPSWGTLKDCVLFSPVRSSPLLSKCQISQKHLSMR